MSLPATSLSPYIALQKQFSQAVRYRGDTYYRGGQVKIRKLTSEMADGRVYGTHTYQVSFVLLPPPAREVMATCTCPHYEGGEFCKHLWGFILAIQTNPQGDFKFPKKPKLIHQWDLLDEDLGDEDSLEEYLDDEYPDRPTTPPVTNRIASDWERKWNATRQDTSWPASTPSGSANNSNREIKIFFGLDKSHLPRSELVIRVYQQRLLNNGKWSVLKNFDGNLLRLPSPISQPTLDLLRRLFGTMPQKEYYGAGNTSINNGIIIHPWYYEKILPDLCATQSLFVQKNVYNSVPLALDQSLAWLGRWTFEFYIEELQNGWELRSRLRQDKQSLTLKECYITTDGLILCDQGVALAVDLPPSRFEPLYRYAPDGVFVPKADRVAFSERLFESGIVDPNLIPSDLKVKTLEVHPKKRLYLTRRIQNDGRNKEGNISAEAKLVYDTQDFDPFKPHPEYFVDPSGHYVRRDKSIEAESTRELTEAGVKAHSDSRGAYLRFPMSAIPVAIPQLQDLGWDVYLEKKLVHRISDFEIQLKSKTNWFELEGKAFSAQGEISFPALLKGLDRAQQFVVLKDGSWGLVPQHWRDIFAPFARMGTNDGTCLRFTKSQAFLIDSLKEKHQVEMDYDAGFEAQLKKLSNLCRISRCKPSERFRGKLRPYQQDGLGWLEFLRELGFGGCLADDMGLGKTVQVLAILDKIHDKGKRRGKNASPSLIMVPRSLLYNWQEEAARFTPHLRVLDFSGVERQTKRNNFKEHDLVLTTYGTLRRDFDHFAKEDFNYLILDEAQFIKNSKTQISQMVKRLQGKSRLTLTGTPVENHIGELHSLFDFLNPGMLGSGEDFHAIFQSTEDKIIIPQVLKSSLKPFMLRRSKEQVLKDLPKKTEQTLHCELKGQQRKHYDELRSYYQGRLLKKIASEGIKKNKFMVLEALLRLRQAACHPGLINPKHRSASSSKLECLAEQLREILSEGHKALVFSQFTKLLDLVAIQLKSEPIPFAYLDGKTRNRAEAVKRFQEDESCKVFLISLKAGGFGLNLTAADYVYILDPWWNPAVESQAIDRSHRLGQTKPVMAYRIIAKNTIEEKILQLQASKKALSESIIAESASLISQITAEDFRFLLD